MLAATHISRSRHLLSEEDAHRIEQLIRAYGPLPRFRAYIPDLLDAASHDKKNKSGTRRFILTQGIGRSIIVENVTDAELTSALTPVLREASR
jgi:3-dehydroquinate synthase